MNYYFSTRLNIPFSAAVKKVTEELEKEGFGIISKIDVTEKFKEKLDIDFRNYKILGACNPSYAYKALQIEDKIGTMLPCNVIIQETEDGKIEVAAIDPIASMQAVEVIELLKVAEEIRKLLKRVIDNL